MPAQPKCSTCGETDPTKFTKNRSRPSGLNSYCKTCDGARARQRRKGKGFYRDYQRRYFMKWKYGITQEQFDELLRLQNGCCAICGVDGAKCRRPGRVSRVEGAVRGENFSRGLVVDHDHKTNVVRGLLCAGCNRGMGMFNDDPVKLSAAAEYLRAHTSCKEAAE